MHRRTVRALVLGGFFNGPSLGRFVGFGVFFLLALKYGMLEFTRCWCVFGVCFLIV